MNKTAITFSSDANYIKYINCLAGTLASNITGDIYCRCVDMTQQDINKIKARDSINLIHDRPKLSNTKTILKDDTASIYYHYGIGRENIRKLATLMYSERSVYTCHSRFKTVNELLAKGYEYVLCLDVDTVILRSIDHMIDHVDGHDLMTLVTYIEPGGIIEYHGNDFYKNETEEHMRCLFNEGMLLIRNTDTSRRFWREIEQYIFKDSNWLEWNQDSNILNRLLNHDYKNLKIFDCDSKYKDGDCDDDSYIWSGESVTKSNQKFIDIVSRYN